MSDEKFPLCKRANIRISKHHPANFDGPEDYANVQWVKANDVESLLAKMQREQWNPIPSFPGYDASTFGRIKSKKHHRPLKLNRDKAGYLRARIWRNNKLHWVFAHRLVLEAFVGPCPKEMQCSHKDGRRDNNNLNNIEWVTPKQNTAIKKEHGTWQCGEKHGAAKLSEKDIQYIRNNFRRESPRKSNTKELARKFGVTANHITNIINKNTWKHLPTPRSTSDE